uniref:Uncharacterized protein n=1 Tax=Hippocampus comes TaxID=109280 RepID=A0A3Q2Y6P0_HIPCM
MKDNLNRTEENAEPPEEVLSETTPNSLQLTQSQSGFDSPSLEKSTYVMTHLVHPRKSMTFPQTPAMDVTLSSLWIVFTQTERKRHTLTTEQMEQVRRNRWSRRESTDLRHS